MMEKLIIDTLLLNAKEYKIDGFRFDIMSFMFTYNMQNIENALQALTVEKDGIDGSKIYLYGEGFNFGDTANNQIGPNASQVNLYGFGIGTFNDRIRDGIRGGSPFTDERVLGFATGLFTDASTFTNGSLSPSQQESQLLQYSDWIDIGLTGNLRDYTFIDSAGATVNGSEVSYNGQPTGYAKSPIEAVNYASVHDNQDLFDAVQLKSSFTDSIATRARRQVMGMALVTLGQGIPFYQGGDDMLRSKDMDQNSYDSGDWFNKIDWTGQATNWGIGLPIASQNQGQWPLMTPLLSNPAYTPQPANISYTAAALQDLLKIRYSSGLFRMATTGERSSRILSFLNTGPSQIPGLIGGDEAGCQRRKLRNVQAHSRSFQCDQRAGELYRQSPAGSYAASAHGAEAIQRSCNHAIHLQPEDRNGNCAGAYDSGLRKRRQINNVKAKFRNFHADHPKTVCVRIRPGHPCHG